MSDIRDAIKDLIDKGFQVVPLRPGQKSPQADETDWPQKHYTKDDFRPGDNVGAKVGAPLLTASGEETERRLYDVDPDCAEAVEALKILAPKTVTFGHAPRKPLSHWLYFVDGQITTKQYRISKKSKPLVELRGLTKKNEIGLQTMLPPSTWTDDKDPSYTELLTWTDSAWPPAVLSVETLETLARDVAIVAAIAQSWPPSGRHELRLALAAYCLRSEQLTAEHTIRLLETAAKIGGSDWSGVRDVRGTVESTERRISSQEAVVCRHALVEGLGQATVTALDRWLGLTSRNALDLFNQSHFVIRVGTTKVKTVVGNDREFPPSFESFASFREFYANETIGEGEDQVKLAPAWLFSRHRRTYHGDLVFAPPPLTVRETIDDKLGDYNLWRGFTVEPDRNPNPEQRCARYLAHIRDVICAGEDHHVFEFLLDVLAHKIQNPGLRTGVAIVLRGAQGIGKNTFSDVYTWLFGKGGIIIEKSALAVGRFNNLLSAKLSVVLDEAVWPGSKEFIGALKAMVTSPTLSIERKGIDATTEPNLLQLFVLTNNGWAWPFEATDRRALVFDVPDTRRGDRTYFDAIYEEMRDPKGQAALLAFLEQRTIRHDLRNVPRTRASVVQFDISADPIERWYLDVLTRGHFDPDCDTFEDWISTEDAFDMFMDSHHAPRLTEKDDRGLFRFVPKLKALLPPGLPSEQKRGVVRWRIRRTVARLGRPIVEEDRVRLRGFRLPSLVACRKAFDAYSGAPHDWPEIEEQNERKMAL